MAGKFHHEAIYRGDAAMTGLSKTRFAICGAGALGSNLAETLVRQGASRLRVIDHDRVEEQNIGTQNYDQADIGQAKAEALRKHLFRATGVDVDSIRKELTAANARILLKDCDTIIDCSIIPRHGSMFRITPVTPECRRCMSAFLRTTVRLFGISFTKSQAMLRVTFAIIRWPVTSCCLPWPSLRRAY